MLVEMLDERMDDLVRDQRLAGTVGWGLVPVHRESSTAPNPCPRIRGRLPQPRQEIAAIPDECRETPSFIDRLGSEASVTIFPVALPFRRSTASRAAMHSATGLTGDRWRLAWHPAPRPR